MKVRPIVVVFGLAIGVPLAFAIRPACACLPLEYREVPLADLPPSVLAEVPKVEPGLRASRAWSFGPGPRLARGKPDGYLVRGRVPDSWWDRDIQVYPDEGPVDLRPAD